MNDSISPALVLNVEVKHALWKRLLIRSYQPNLETKIELFSRSPVHMKSYSR